MHTPPPSSAASSAALLSADLLRQCTGCSAELAARFAPHLVEACASYGIDSTARLAAFLAQIGHESGALRHVREIWGPTSAQARYEGRTDLGNTQPGDGSRYRGRGLIQTTGRANYATTRDRLRQRFADVPDFEAEPEALEQARWAALSAGAYWDWRGLNALADVGDFEAITRRINGGLNGLADREARLQRARDALTTAKETPPVSPLLVPLASALIDAFRPLATEKLRAAMQRHTDQPAVVEQLVTSIVDGAKTLSGASDPIQAVAAVQADPEKLQRLEAAALDRLSGLLPMFDKLAEIEARERAIDEASREAAARRAAIEPWDMTRALVYGMGAVLALLILLVFAVALIQLFRGNGEIASEVWAQVAGLIGFSTGVGVTVYAYRFGTSRSSATKDLVISNLTASPAAQRPGEAL